MWGGVGVLSPASCGNGQAEVGHLATLVGGCSWGARSQGEWVAHAVCIKVKPGHKEEGQQESVRGQPVVKAESEGGPYDCEWAESGHNWGKLCTVGQSVE